MIAKIQLKLNNDVLLTVIKMVQQTDDYLVENVTDALLISVKEDLINKLEDKAKNIQKQVSILDHNKKHSMVLKYHEAYTLYKLLDAVDAKQLFNDSPHIKKIKRLINELHNKVDIFAKEDDFIDTEEEITEEHNSEINKTSEIEPILFSFDFEQENVSVDEIKTTEQLEFNAEIEDTIQDSTSSNDNEQLEFNAKVGDTIQDSTSSNTNEQLEFNAEVEDTIQDSTASNDNEQLEFNAEVEDTAQDSTSSNTNEQLEFNAEVEDTAQDSTSSNDNEQLEFNAEVEDTVQDSTSSNDNEQLEFNAEVEDNSQINNEVVQPNFSEYFAIQKQGLSNVETTAPSTNTLNENEEELSAIISNIKDGIEQAEKETAKDVMQIEIFDVLDLDNKPLEKDSKAKSDKKKEKKEKKSDSQEGQISLF